MRRLNEIWFIMKEMLEFIRQIDLYIAFTESKNIQGKYRLIGFDFKNNDDGVHRSCHRFVFQGHSDQNVGSPKFLN